MRTAIAVALAVAIGLYGLLAFPVEPVEAASMTFTSDTMITTDLTIAAGETWIVNPGVTLTIASGVTITNFGSIENIAGGTINNYGTISNSFEIDNSGNVINYGTIDNIGTIVNLNHSEIENNGSITNSGTIHIFGSSITNSGGSITNSGTIIASDGTISNSGSITNSGGSIILSDSFFINKCGATFNNDGTITGNTVINEACHYGLVLFETADYSDGIVGLNQEVTAEAQTNDVSVDSVKFTWFNPSDIPIEIEIVPLSLTGQFDSSFEPNEVGEWTVEADFNNGVVIRETLKVPFSVIPESQIGIIALMASSFAALAGFVLIGVRHGNSHAGSQNNLGI